MLVLRQIAANPAEGNNHESNGSATPHHFYYISGGSGLGCPSCHWNKTQNSMSRAE